MGGVEALSRGVAAEPPPGPESVTLTWEERRNPEKKKKREEAARGLLTKCLRACVERNPGIN